MMTIGNDNGSIAERIGRPFAMNRRKLMKSGALATAGLSVGAMTGMGSAFAAGTGATVVPSDADVLNFALNLEYLEANYYLLGVTGSGLTSSMTGGGPVPTAPATTLVPFQTQQLASYFLRIAADEYAHVNFLRAALGSAAVVQPQLDLMASFTALAQAAGLITSTQTFNPFASEIDFLIGAYIFEDVGVTAYAGGAAYLASADNIAYAGSVLAMEGYHSGAIRGYLASQGGGGVTNAIANLRAELSGTNMNGIATDDNGTDLSSTGGNPINIVNVDGNGQVFRRSFNQVLNVVYAGVPAGGLFFPAGMNGTITNSGSVYNPQIAS